MDFSNRGVRIIERFAPPLPIGSARTVYDSANSVSGRIGQGDATVIEENWKAYEKGPNHNGRLFNYLRHSVIEGQLVVIGSGLDYKAYQAAADARDHGLQLSREAREIISPVVVSALVFSSDGRVATRKRTEALARGKYDCSASGLCVVEDGAADPAKTLLECMGRELGLSVVDVGDIAVTGFSESRDYNARMIACTVTVLKSSRDIREPSGNIVWVESHRLGDFISEKYPETLDDFVGASVLGLPGRQGEVLAERLREDNVDSAIAGI